MDAEPLAGDRRARRRQETIEEILTIAAAVMDEEGVNGLSLSEVARRLGVKPPSIYKYFDSLLDIYDALFARGQQANLEALRAAAAAAEPGMSTLLAITEAAARWCVANPALGQLLFYRPVPSFEPSPAAMAHSEEMFRLHRQALAEAVARGELGPGADSDEGVLACSVVVSGVVGQSIANEPGVAWGDGRFSGLLSRLIGALVVLYPLDAELSVH